MYLVTRALTMSRRVTYSGKTCNSRAASRLTPFVRWGPGLKQSLTRTTLTVETRLNGEVKQKGNTADMAFPVAFLIRYISDIMTLYRRSDCDWNACGCVAHEAWRYG